MEAAKSSPCALRLKRSAWKRKRRRRQRIGSGSTKHRKRGTMKRLERDSGRLARLHGWAEEQEEKTKVAGELKAPKLRKEERKDEEAYHGLDRNGGRVLRPGQGIQGVVRGATW